MSTQVLQNDWKESALSKIEPRRTALLVIDLQKDFCSESGALAALGSDVSRCREVAARIADFLSKVREYLAFTAFFQLIYDPEKMSEPQKERLIKNGSPIICAVGSGGTELVVAPEPTDLKFVKHRYSAFSNEQFLHILQEQSITTIVTVGVDTHICVEGTVRQGYDLGYRMVVLSDLVATRQSESGRHENSLAVCERYFALTMESDALLQLLRSNNIKVYQSDGG